MCCGATEDTALDVGCTLKRRPTSNGNHHKRVLTRCCAFTHPECYQPTFHYDCPDNQIRSLVGRVAGVVPHPTPDGMYALYRARDYMCRFIYKTCEAPLEDMPERYGGAKRVRYRNALADLQHFGIHKSHAAIKFFIKAERFDPTAKVDPDPRAIQFRGPRYAVDLASYLHPIEPQIYNFKYANEGVPRTRSVAKGLNSYDRAMLMKRKLESFRNPTVVSLDASRFDKHVTDPLLRVEHSVYLHSNSNPHFAQLLSWQIVNRGFSNLGLKYVLLGRRMSGDMNTAVGNCLLMLMMLITFFRLLGCLKWDCLDDGDDVIVIVEREMLAKVLSECKPTFLTFGMQMKIDGFTDDPMQITFCRSNMVEYAPHRFKFVRDFRDVTSKALCGIRHWEDESYRLRVLRAIGTCELVLNLGVPILQEFALAILRNVGLPEAVDLAYAPDGLLLRTKRDLSAMRLKISDLAPQAILPCARETFARAFGVGENEQIRMEARYREWSFDVRGLAHYGEEIFVPTWTLSQAVTEVYRQ